ncbi:MAG: transposase [Candidatus Dormiibacterota bacterium]
MARLRALHGLSTAPSCTDHSPAEAELVAWALELRCEILGFESLIKQLEARLPQLLAERGSTLTQEFGIGVVSAAELVAQVGDARRFRSESAFARWCGVAPVAVSSGEGAGQPRRHRLDLLGNRAVNRILYTMSVTQASHHPPGREFLQRKRHEGKSLKEARRAHKRLLANRVIRRMWADTRNTRRTTSVCIAVGLTAVA